VTDGLVVHPYAADDDLVAAVRADGRPRARVYRCPELAVVLGRGSRPAAELHVGTCLADRVPVYRRRGGGCAVVIDPGNLVLIAAVALPGLGRVRESMDRCTDWALELLARCDIRGIARCGISDLTIGERKVGGASLHRTNGFVTYGTTLLVEPDLALIERYLAHPPREPEYRRGRGHLEFVGSLAALGAWSHGAERLRERIAEALAPPELR
jgi:lipoate-protein ligase A